RHGSLVGVIVPFIGLLVAVYGFWGWGLSWIDLGVLVAMYIATGLGMTIGFHRLFTHRSFETIRPIKVILAVLGSMTVQGPLLRWVAMHRRHHQHSDQVEDPHSPHRFGGGFLGVLAGWWHAHVGWIFKPDAPGLDRYIQDLERDEDLRRVSRLFGVWVALGLVIPAVAGGLITGTWSGAALGFLWGGLVRVFLVHHATWSINSVCHLWGSRPFESGDESRNNLVFGVLAFGEGWHNSHHAFPTSARHGLRWWQPDLSYLVICVMKLLGLAWRVRLPAPESVLARRSLNPREHEPICGGQ
ncbi:MAG: acyl-CoA desaturase, partial [bacterium]|nr:acyl-CoA desaturase [bacterium]